MLERFTLGAPFNELSKRVGFLAVEWALEVQVQLHAGHFKQMGQKQFRLEARRFNVSLRQKVPAFLNGFENSHVEYVEMLKR